MQIFIQIYSSLIANTRPYSCQLTKIKRASDLVSLLESIHILKTFLTIELPLHDPLFATEITRLLPGKYLDRGVGTVPLLKFIVRVSTTRKRKSVLLVTNVPSMHLSFPRKRMLQICCRYESNIVTKCHRFAGLVTSMFLVFGQDRLGFRVLHVSKVRFRFASLSVL